MSDSDDEDQVTITVELPTGQAAVPSTVPIVLQIAHCIFPGDGTLLHWINSDPMKLSDALPRLFVASIMKDVQGGRVVAGCCLFATDLEENYPDFKEKLLQTVENVPKLKEKLEKRARLICVRLTKPSNPLTEANIMQVFSDQYIKRGVGGRG